MPRIGRKNKYGVAPKEARTRDGIVFASKAEMLRYCDLKVMEGNGYIEDLQLQPRYKIEVNGTKICTYVADFTYTDLRLTTCKVIVEDVKGVLTPVYKLKKKLFEAVYAPLKITEI